MCLYRVLTVTLQIIVQYVVIVIGVMSEDRTGTNVGKETL